VTAHESSTDGDVPPDEREALLSIAHGAVVTSGGVSVQRALAIWIEAILTRGLGPAAYGVYAFGWRITRMCLTFANLGTNVTLQRDVPAYADEPERQRRSLGLAYVTTALGSLGIAAVIVLAADWINAVTIDRPSFPLVLSLFAALLVFTGFLRLQTATLKAVKSANGEALLNRVLRPGVRLVGAAAAMALGYSVVGTVGALVVAVGALTVVSYPVTAATTGLRPTVRGIRSQAAHFYDHALPSAMSGIGRLLRVRIDVVLIGLLLTATAAGIYNVVLVLTAMASTPLVAFNQLMPPVAADLYADDETDTLNDVYTTVTRLVVTTTLPFVATLAVFGPALLGIFGPEYRRGYPILLVFLVGRFVGSAVGATGILLSMTNNHYLKMGLEWLLVVLNLVLTYAFVVEFGLIGAALGTSVSIGVQNFLQAVALLRLEGLWPFDATYLKPLGASLGMAAVMVGVRVVLDGVSSVVVGVVLGLAAFVVLLRAFGVDPRDRFVLRELAASYRSVLKRKVG
jgi:O-antigen/teichoic acid export membrane protein